MDSKNILETILRVSSGVICLLTVALYPVLVIIFLMVINDNTPITVPEIFGDEIAELAVRMTTLLLYSVFFVYFLRFLYWSKEAGVGLWNKYTFPFEPYEPNRPEYHVQSKIDECRSHAKLDLIYSCAIIAISFIILLIIGLLFELFNLNVSEDEIVNNTPPIIVDVIDKLPVVSQFVTFFDFLPDYGPIWRAIFLLYCLPLTAAMRNYAFVFEHIDHLGRKTLPQRARNSPYFFTLICGFGLLGIALYILSVQ